MHLFLEIINADIEDNEKRWLIIGICIQSVLAPTLRKFAEPVTRNLYSMIQNTHGIQTQIYPDQLKQYPNAGHNLNYEAINNNHLIPRVRRTDVGKYDYKVTSHVEFSKLFLKTFMAKYTAFDESCDLSALLGIIINIDTFSKPVKNVALKVSCYFQGFNYIGQGINCGYNKQVTRIVRLNT